MKRNEERNAHNKEVETADKKHFELAEDELGPVSGGADLYLQGADSPSGIGLNGIKENTSGLVLNSPQNAYDNIVLQGSVQNPQN